MQVKLVLNGKTINLTSDNTTIKSNNFNVDEYGNMTANNGTFTGKIKGSEITGSSIKFVQGKNDYVSLSEQGLIIKNSAQGTSIWSPFIRLEDGSGNYIDINAESIFGSSHPYDSPISIYQKSLNKLWMRITWRWHK